MQLARERDDRAEAGGGRIAGGADGVEQVRGPVRSGRRRRPHRAGDHDRCVGAVQQVAQHGGLLQRVGAVREHDSAPRRRPPRRRRGRCRARRRRSRGRRASPRACARAGRGPPRAAAPRRPARRRRAAAGRRSLLPSRSSRRPRAPSPRAREALPDPIPRLAPGGRGTANFRSSSAHVAPFGSTRLPPRQRPTEQVGLYDPRYEHDACGVAFVARLSGEPSHETVQRAITALENLEHRGAAGRRPEHRRRRRDAAAAARRAAARADRRRSCRRPAATASPSASCRRRRSAAPSSSGCSPTRSRPRASAIVTWRDIPVEKDYVGITANWFAPYIKQLVVAASPSSPATRTRSSASST